MGTSAVFPRTAMRAGMYESFYLRAVAPQDPVGVWIRHTVHKRPGAQPLGSVWFTLFDARRGGPLMHKLTTPRLEVPPEGWIAIGEAVAPGGEGGTMAADRAWGTCGPASWRLSWSSSEPELRHLPREALYRAPLPRTKLTSPAPLATFEGEVQIEGRPPFELRGWRGMVGHNWGSEHAERWIWLHAAGFEEAPDAWLDLALGRVKVGPWTSPWVANGALALDGRRHRLGGLAARGLRVAQTAEGCAVRVPGERGFTVKAQVQVPAGTAAGWRYADPASEGSLHDVLNCSIAAVEVGVTAHGVGSARSLHSAHGGAFELGMRERTHGVPIAPFPDG
jgi:hypothetical protein